MARHTTPSALLAELARLRAENARLRDLATRNPSERERMAIKRIVDKAKLDAAGLILLHVGGGHTGRQFCGLPQRRWRYAVALLRLARLATRRRDLRLTPGDDATAALAQLDAAAATALRDPAQFARHIPPSLRPDLLQRTLAMQPHSPNTTHTARR